MSFLPPCLRFLLSRLTAKFDNNIVMQRQEHVSSTQKSTSSNWATTDKSGKALMQACDNS